jgi:predicted Zn finger-like uncharacterized protein
MQIECPNCTTAYEIDGTKLGAGGRSVRCVRCRSVWRVDATPQPAAPKAAATAGGEEDLSAWGLSDADEPAAKDDEAAPAAEAEEALPAEDFSKGPRGDDALERATLGESGPVDIADAPPLAPNDDPAPADAEPEPDAREDVETAAARRAAADGSRRFRLPRPNSVTLILALVAVIAGLFAWRADVVRMLPQTGSFFSLLGMPVNLRGLAIVEVKTTREIHDNVPVLVVEGAVANVAKTPLEVPRLRFAVRSERHAELYTWTVLPGRTILSSGDRIPFRSRLASPPGEGREVSVRFFNRRDIAAGLR